MTIDCFKTFKVARCYMLLGRLKFLRHNTAYLLSYNTTNCATYIYNFSGYNANNLSKYNPFALKFKT